MAVRKIAGLGWRPDTPDWRDRRLALAPPMTLPPSVDLRSKLPPPYRQGQIGSCTANAIAAAIEFDRKKQNLIDFIPSRLFIYFCERTIEGTVLEDAGAEIRDGIKAVNQWGAPEEEKWPYVESHFATNPDPVVYIAAKEHLAIEYVRLHATILELKTCLANGYPFVFGFSVYEFFESEEMACSAMLLLPQPEEQLVGGHAVLGCGYDDNKGCFLIRNSWGPDWGEGGYFWMPFPYLTNKDLSDDFWKISTVS